MRGGQSRWQRELGATTQLLARPVDTLVMMPHTSIRLTVISWILVATTTITTAQPALTPATPQLTADERALLARGEIGEGVRIGSITASVVLGLGTGQAIQGRWLERGWIFTVGEVASVGLAAVAASESDLNVNLTDAMAFVGWSSFVGLHVWEVVDAASAPERHNCRVRELRRRASQTLVAVIPFVTPSPQGEGAIGGVLLRF
jgi:hypothetical protein